jgi:hypothetical protein
VVAAVVLDVEMPVGGRREGHLGQPPFHPLTLVTQLVGGVDGDAVDHSDGDHQAGGADDREIVAGPDRAADHQGRVLRRQVEVGQPAVVAVGGQPGHRLLGRVAPVVAEQQVDDRDQAEHDDRGEPPRPADAGAPPQREAGEG